ncbi:MAG: Gfo/Idh/MocA family oxidoreductase [Ktedonobacterales bacterium]
MSSASSGVVRVGIVGYGLAGSVFHAPLVSSTPGMAVAAIVTGDPERQARARRDYPNVTLHTTADEMLADPSKLDLVVVAAPNRAHVPVGLAALEAGLPVVIDKPLAPSTNDAERLIQAAKQRGKLLSVFQNRRWDNDFLTVRKLIDADLLGAVTRFESRFERFRPTLKGGWRERGEPEEGGGLLFDLGAHLIDQALVLFGWPTSVYAEMSVRREGALVDDDTFVALRFAGGEVAHLWMSVIPRQLGPRLRLVGMRGVYEKQELDPQEEALRTGMRPGDEGWGEEPRERWGHLVTSVEDVAFDGHVGTVPGSYETYYALMRDALVHGGPPPVTAESSLATLRIIEAARESASRGQVVAPSKPSISG